MYTDSLKRARVKMSAAGVDSVAIDVFTHYFGLVAEGATGMIAESTIEPIDMPALADVDVPETVAHAALAKTALIKLNGGLGTSMGMDCAKSLLPARGSLTFLDIMVGQVLAARAAYGAKLPLTFMNSFRTSADTMNVLASYPDLRVDSHPLEFLQNMVPKLRLDDLAPVDYPADPELEWCPPGHGDLYPAIWSAGLLGRLIESGFTQVFVSNSDNLGATPDPKVAGWFASSGAPFAIEAVRRTSLDRKGGHFARRRTDGRIVLRETAQTGSEDRASMADLSRHQFMSTNNLWFDLRAMKDALDRSGGVLGLTLIKNQKTVNPAVQSSTQVMQLETAMGSAIELFDGAATIEVTRERFIPVKTTNDLLLLRSDFYELRSGFLLSPRSPQLPHVDLDPVHYTMVSDFDERFVEGAPSLRHARQLRVRGDWTFGAEVKVIGRLDLEDQGLKSFIRAGSVLGNELPDT